MPNEKHHIIIGHIWTHLSRPWIWITYLNNVLVILNTEDCLVIHHVHHNNVMKVIFQLMEQTNIEEEINLQQHVPLKQLLVV